MHLQFKAPDPDLRHCEIIYFSSPSASRVPQILNRTQGAYALTVGEDEEFLHRGGMLALVRSGDSLQIEVNLDSVEAEDLKISSRLLELAIVLHAGRPGQR
jgi:hypothetical protein